MDHINTYPNLYIEDETYVAHQWDFCDFEEKSIDILANSGKYEHIAREGQRKFQETLSDGKGFAIQFESFIN